MKFERLTVTHYKLSAGFQHDTPAIFGDDLDLIHGAEVAVQRIADLLADIISRRGRHYMGNIHSASLLAAIAKNTLGGRIEKLKISGEIQDKNNLVLACLHLFVGPLAVASVGHKNIPCNPQ